MDPAEPMTALLQLYGAIGLAVVVLVAGVRIAIAVYRRKGLAALLAELDGEEVLRCEPAAHYFGQKSVAWPRPRGHGALVLTSRRLRFRLWSPPTELDIPVGAITGLAAPLTARGGVKPQRALYVIFENRPGEDDAATWLVSDPGAWTEELAQVADGPAEVPRSVDVGWWEPPKP